MLASAPRLSSADQPMKTSVLRQRKGSVRKQHLLSWAWQQGRGQVVEILQLEKRLKGDKEAEDGCGERYNIPAPQTRNVSKNQQQLSRQKTKDQNSQMKIVHKKKERRHTYNSSSAAWQAMQMGGRTKIFQTIKTGTLAYQVPPYFLSLKLIRTMPGPNLVSHHDQVFFLNQQATGFLFPLILLIKK